MAARRIPRHLARAIRLWLACCGPLVMVVYSLVPKPRIIRTMSSTNSRSRLCILSNDYDFNSDHPQPDENWNIDDIEDDEEAAMGFLARNRQKSNLSSKFGTALAIIPPLLDWDRLQRARHFARDVLFHKCPPAIRLFHPFLGEALDVAAVIEELELEPFEITLDTWVIVPHVEALEAGWKASKLQARAGPDDRPDEDENYDDFYNMQTAAQQAEDEAIQKLIREEERIGKEKAIARAKKRAADAGEDVSSIETPTNQEEEESTKSPSELFEEQQQQFEKFGGPCILCLEPNAKSKRFLQDLREEMALLLDHDEYSSPSSCYNWKKVTDPIFRPDDEYRPLIPIGSFESLPLALKVARRLKGLWGEALTFRVDDLHVLSCQNDDEPNYSTIWAPDAPSSISALSATPEISSVTEAMTQQAWGCNAKIMLLGEEVQHDESATKAMIDQLLDEGEAGGMDISNDFTILEDEEEPTLSDIEQYLDNDDDWDEGTQVVIGRTHFYTGEQRTYKGMPASSVVDAKDRALGDHSGGGKSGLARRRRTSTGNRRKQWDDFEFGHRLNDHLPWTKQESPKRKIDDLGFDTEQKVNGADETTTDEPVL